MLVLHRCVDGPRALFMAVVVGSVSVAAGPLTAGCASQDTRPAAADELLVGFAAGTTSAEAAAIYEPLGATKVEELREISVHRIRVAPGSLESVERTLKANPAVRYVERNRQVRPN
jgi:hypothetical protein